MERIGLPNRPELVLEFDADNQTELGPCPVCGEKTKRVWGYIYNADAAAAAYYVEWNPAHPERERERRERDAFFDLILGKWGDTAGPQDSRAVSVRFRVLDTGPSFMVQVASVGRDGSDPLVSGTLDRSDVVGKPIASTVFEICDLIYLADPRIAELRR
jgi:hypothetical protein